MKKKLFAIAFALLILASLSWGGSFHPASATTNIPDPTFVWFFGYVGGYFYPQTQLGLNQSQMIAVASTITHSVKNVSFVTVVSQTQVVGHGAINWTHPKQVAPIKSYVQQLKQAGASVLYGRLDLAEFNMTSNPSIYFEVGKYVRILNLSGIWLDHAATYYAAVNQTNFNKMMQNLTSTFHLLRFIMNHTEYKQGLIMPVTGDTWQNMTYISPSFSCKSTQLRCYVADMQIVQEFNAKYPPGHVVVHFDAYAKLKGEPMSVFSGFSNTTEAGIVKTLAAQGTHPTMSSEAYLMLYPIIGGWTYLLGPYGGSLYDSLSIGTFPRDTLQNFTSTMMRYNYTVP